MLALAACATHDRAPPPAGAHIDPVRFSGLWFELMHTANLGDRDCTGDVTLEFVPRDGITRVVRRCRTAFGGSKRRVARAWTPLGRPDSQFETSTIFPFSMRYRVLAVAPDYAWALVGSPDRERVIVLARTPALDPALRDAIVDRAAEFGYDTVQLRPVLHRQ